MNKAELEKKIANYQGDIAYYESVSKLNLEHANDCKEYIGKLEAQLAELNKTKTGQVKIGDEFKKGMEIFYINYSGSVQCFKCGYSIDRNNLGREFYDLASAELFALREKTEFKIWCKFGDDVRVDILPWLESRTYLGVCYACRTPPEALHKFIDTLSPEELNSIRSE